MPDLWDPEVSPGCGGTNSYADPLSADVPAPRVPEEMPSPCPPQLPVTSGAQGPPKLGQGPLQKLEGSEATKLMWLLFRGPQRAGDNGQLPENPAHWCLRRPRLCAVTGSPESTHRAKKENQQARTTCPQEGETASGPAPTAGRGSRRGGLVNGVSQNVPLGPKSRPLQAFPPSGGLGFSTRITPRWPSFRMKMLIHSFHKHS